MVQLATQEVVALLCFRILAKPHGCICNNCDKYLLMGICVFMFRAVAKLTVYPTQFHLAEAPSFPGFRQSSSGERPIKVELR